MGNNEFLYPAIANGRHGRRCFCLDCRERQVSVIVDSDLTNNQLEREFISNAEEYRRLNSLFDETLKSIVRGEAFRQQCLHGTPYNCFGWWMRSQPQYSQLSTPEKRRLCKKVRMAHEVFIHWEKIAQNLNDVRISFVDARKLSVQQLHEAIEMTWCLEYDEFLRGPGDIPDVLLYQEETYRVILEYIVNSGILVDIGHDSKESTRLGRRLQKDINKICKYIKSTES